MRILLPSVAIFAVLLAGPAHAVEHVVSQKGKAFSHKKLAVQAGDSVKFVNDDPFNHNVFSLSEAKSFDLGSYGQGLAKSIVLDRPGLVEIECAVHPDMKLLIEVKE